MMMTHVVKIFEPIDDEYKFMETYWGADKLENLEAIVSMNQIVTYE